MKGDFTRGHRPDQKRGAKYRRVLLQEGRLVLDSDIAAGVDAIDTQIRDLASDVGCETGSPNLGYLATPGPLLALFETLDGVALPGEGDPFEAYRDYGAKYHERFPSIYINGQAGAGTVGIHGRRLLTAADYPVVRIWARAAAGLTVDIAIEGQFTTFVGTDATTFQPYDVPIPGGVVSYKNIDIGFNSAVAGNEVWIGFIEGFQPAAERPLFWYTNGRYYLRGLAVESAADGQFPDATFPPAVGFTPADLVTTGGVYVVAYLEGWERLITRIEDPGILEQALGGVLDTTIRSKPVGQVKLAFIANDGSDPLASAGLVVDAFANVDVGTAQLDITTTPAVVNPDPCAIPEAGGYFGADNRFYRFEVHTGGALGDVLIKWSKNNGSDVFAVTSVQSLQEYLVLASGAEVRDGDLIELLDEPDDLGDQTTAEVALTTPKFTPARRSVGQLFYAETTQTAGQIKLRDLATKSPALVPVGFGAANTVPKVRVWHGLLDTKPVNMVAVTHFELADGVVVDLSGADFRPGDYWQYEARKLKDNANGAWQKSPHGPERIFAPLALFKYESDTDPLTLIRWYDHQYSAICDLNADDIAYDGSKVGTDADTVQEALDELYEKTGGGCCDMIIEPQPQGGDDTARIQQAINDLPDGQELCLMRGIYHVSGQLVVDSKRVTIVGCPHATIIGDIESGEPVFFVKGFAQLELRDLLVFARGSTGPVVHLAGLFFGEVVDVELEGGKEINFIAQRLTLERTALVHVSDTGVAVRSGEPTPLTLDPKDPQPFESFFFGFGGSIVDVKESILAAVRCVEADTVQVYANDSLILFEQVGVSAHMLSWARLFKSNLYGSYTQFMRQGLLETVEEQLEGAVLALLDGFFFSVTGSIGIAAPTSFGGPIEACSFFCDTALCFGYAWNVASRNTEYFVSTPGIRIDYVDECRFDHDTFSAGDVALHVPWQTYRLEVSHCSIDATRAFVLGATWDAQPLPDVEGWYPTFSYVKLHANHLVTGTGVQIGPYFEQAAAVDPIVVSMQVIEITSNCMSPSFGNSFGVVCSFLSAPGMQGELKPGEPRLRIADNKIDASVGVVALGDDVIVQNNEFHATNALTNIDELLGLNIGIFRWIGILLSDGGRLVVRGNVIELDIGPVAGFVLSGGILLNERYSEGARGDITIQENVVTAHVPFFSPEGEQQTGVSLLMLGDNRFVGVLSFTEIVFVSTIRNNVFVGPFGISSGGENVVSNNQFFQPLPGFGSSVGGFEANEAILNWQIENNRSYGDIIVQPLRGEFGDPGIMEEALWHPQAVGNSVERDLVIGYPDHDLTVSGGFLPGTLRNTSSRVQIVANRAGAWLVTNNYLRVVFAHNFAKDYSPPAWSTATPIISPNFNAP